MPTPFSRFHARVAIPLLLLAGAVGFTGYHYASASTPYSVQSGDTLYDIANKNGVDTGQLDFWVSQVVALNGLSSADALVAGQQLTLPVVLSGGGGGSAGGGVSSTTQTPAPSASSTSYTVKDGDTLYGIASNNGVKDVGSWMASVLSLNGLNSGDNINVGDVIKLPGTASSSSSSGGSSSSTSSTSSTTQYTVVAGDTLYDIAVKNGVAEKDLGAWVANVLKLNNLDTPDMLALGAALKVPSKSTSNSSGSSSSSSSSTTFKNAPTTNYTVKIGDTLYDIAMAHGAKDSNYAAWVDVVTGLNSLTSPDVLTAGDSLKIPDVSSSSSSSSSPSNSSSSSSSGSSSGSSSTTSTLAATKPTYSFSGGSVTYNVKSGDTLAGIAAKMNVPTDQISFWIDNALSLSKMSKDDKLAEGIVLLIPSEGSITSNSTPPAAGSTATTPSNSSGSGSSGGSSSSSSSSSTPSKVTSSYTVQSGDTLDDIATKYKIGAGQLGGWISDVLSMNSLDSADVISVGQKLTVPGAAPDTSSSAPKPTTAASGTPGTAPSTKLPPRASLSSTPGAGSSSSTTAAATATPSVKKNGGTCYYTVLSGDTWDSIASKLGVSNDKKQDWIDGIGALNGLKNNALPVGDAIRLLC